MTQLSVKLFGRPALLVDGQERATTPQQVALLGLLYGHEREGLNREEVATFLWSEGTDDPLRRRLSQLLYALTSRATSTLIVRAGDTLARSPLVATDLVDFDRHLAEGRFDDAAQLCKAGFLDVLPDVPTSEYQRWMDARRQGLRKALRAAAARQWSLAEGQGRWGPKALSAALALHRLDPDSEPAMRNVMWAQALSSSPAEAIATYESFVEMRPDGTEVAVSSETRTLLQRIRSLARQKRGSSPALQPSQREPRMYGREAEVARLRPLLSDPQADALTTIAIAGDGGLGKTRLLRESLSAASLQGRLILEARLAELEKDVALNALTEALSTREVAETLTRVEDPWRSVVLTFLPEFAQVAGPPIDVPEIQRSSLHRRLLESLRQLFDQIAASHSVVIVLDDFHWVDDSSLAALEYIRRRWKHGTGTLVLTYRPEHVEKGSKLESFLHGEASHQFALAPLDVPSQKQLTTEIGGSELDPRLADRIHTLAKGNPLFLIELTRQCLDGELELSDFAADDIHLPRSIQQLFDRRIARLSETDRRVLEALSVWGRTASLADLTELTTFTEDELAASLERLDAAGLVRWTERGTELWHELLRQSVLRKTSGPRRLILHRRASEALRVGPAAEAIAEIALHCHRAGDRISACDYSKRAADEAERVGATAEAIFFLRIAEENASRPAERLNFCHRRGLLLLAGCQYSTASSAFTEALDLAQGQPDGSLQRRLRLYLLEIRSRQADHHSSVAEDLEAIWRDAEMEFDYSCMAMATERALRHHERLGRFTSFAPIALERISRCAAAPDQEARLIGLRLGLLHAFTGDMIAADVSTAAALRVAREREDEAMLLSALDARVAFYAMSTRLNTADGLELLSEATRLAARLGDLPRRFSIANNAGAHALECGELSLAQQRFKECERVVAHADLVPEIHRLRNNLGELSLEQHDFASARLYFETTLQLAASLDDDIALGARLGVAICDLEAGRLAQATSAAHVVMQHIADKPSPLIDSGLVHRLDLLVARRTAGASAARAKAWSHFDQLSESRPGRWIGLFLFALPLLRSGDATRTRREARRCLDAATRLGLGERVRQLRVAS